MAKAGRPAQHVNDFKPESLLGVPGYVRAGQTLAGQWWLLSADNRPFFARGVAGVNRFGRVGGRGAQPGPYELAIEQRYGGGTAGFVPATLKRLRSLHCNTLGAWTGPEFFECGMFYVETVGFRHAAPETTIKLGGALLPDVFDPRWVNACEALAAERCAPRQASRELIGYFTDHGLQWLQPLAAHGTAARRERPTLLQVCLSLEPGFTAYHAAWEFVLAPHGGNLDALAASWGIEANREALRQLTLADTPVTSDGYRKDQDRFTREFARRYFQTCAAAIRRHDANHLVLGCSFESPPGEAVLAESVNPFVQVLAVHSRDMETFETIDTFARASGMPVLLAEFSWNGEAFTVRQSHERRQLTSVERMLTNGRAVLARACAHPSLVGYIWARWADTPEELPPFGTGLVHVNDLEALEHTELLAALNDRADALRRITGVRLHHPQRVLKPKRF